MLEFYRAGFIPAAECIDEEEELDSTSLACLWKGSLCGTCEARLRKRAAASASGAGFGGISDVIGRRNSKTHCASAIASLDFSRENSQAPVMSAWL